MNSKENAKWYAQHRLWEARDKLSELAEDPRGRLPYASRKYKSWLNEVRVASRVFEYAQQTLRG